MAWIESHQEVARHPKTRRLAQRLGIPIPAAVGHLHCLWHWALSFAESGDITEYDAEEISLGAMWDASAYRRPDYEGNPDHEAFVKALVDCGWIDEVHGQRVLHNWWKYAGHLIAARKAAVEAGTIGNHKRWHEDRGISEPSCRLCIEALSGGDRGAISGGDIGGDRVANRPDSHRTVPNPTVPNQDPNPSPNGLARSRKLSTAEQIAHDAIEHLQPHVTSGDISSFELYEAATEQAWKVAVKSGADPPSATKAVLGAFFEEYLERKPEGGDWSKLGKLVKDFGIESVYGLSEAMAKAETDWFPYARAVCKRRLVEQARAP